MKPLKRILKGTWSQPDSWTLNRPLFATPVSEEVKIENSFEDYVQAAYKANGIVFACILARLLVFSEARFQWRRFEQGRPTDLFGDQALELLERPWPNGTTGELLAHMEQDASLAGNFYATVVGQGTPIDSRGPRRIRRLRPDWVTIITGSESDDPFALDAKPVAYMYQPKAGRERQAVLLTPDQIVHYSPIPDPEAQWRGMSWITPIVREIQADSGATKHKLQFFTHGAVPGLVISYSDKLNRQQVQEFAELFAKNKAGAENAYKTLHLGGGADAKAVGADLQQLDFKNTQGAGETRIAAAAGVHPVIVGLSEGLQGAALNAGNFASARRRFADGTIRPLWRMAAAALETIVVPPARAQLWYDDRDVPFLREDAKEEAQILSTDAQSIRALVDAGFDADKAVLAVTSKDLRGLTGAHSGLFSVQLQPPTETQEPANGSQ